MKIVNGTIREYMSTSQLLYNEDMSEAPLGVKMICRNPGGVAVFAQVNNQNKEHFDGWCPMPMKGTPANIKKSLLQKIEQVVRLIRSKGVGVYFISQSPSDMPDAILAQLGNRIQHALRAYTPSEQKAVRVAAQSFRTNPNLDTAAVISEMSVGEALVSTLQDKGVPSMVERVLIRPPQSRMGPISSEERQAVLAHDPNQRIYKDAVDPRSAHEILQERMAQTLAQAQEAKANAQAKRAAPAASRSSGQSNAEAFAKSMARSLGTAAGSTLGRQLLRGVLGSLLKK